MRQLTIVYFLLMFFLFRPFQLERPGLLYPGDDYSYFAYSTAVVFGEYPNFDKEAVDEFRVPPLSRLGPAVLSLPFTLLGSIVDRVSDNPIVSSRTPENIRSSWTLFGAIFASGVAAWLAMFVMYRTLQYFVSARASQWSVIAALLLPGSILYAYRRPVFSHVYELLIQTALVFIFVQVQTKSRWQKKDPGRKTLFFSIALCSLALMVRQNGVLFALLWPLLIFCVSRWKLDLTRKTIFRALIVISCSLGIFYLFKYLPEFFYRERYVRANAVFETNDFLWALRDPWFYIKRSWSVIFGIDWGLLYTAPHLLLGAASIPLMKPEMRRWFYLLVVPVLVNFYLCVVWEGQGSWYGYRYFVFSAAPILCVSLALFWQRVGFSAKTIHYSLVFAGIAPLFSILLFDATPGTILTDTHWCYD